MTERGKKKAKLEEIIKIGVTKELENYDMPDISDEEMNSLGHPLPPEEILEEIKNKQKK